MDVQKISKTATPKKENYIMKHNLQNGQGEYILDVQGYMT